ncbi:unnamed protein product [Cylicostephanus goldi]|uniref:Uncharacterized protein n=1 Tax=Cylicostephanus goldi TaxID=71465 RepID=A0A3P7R615_CYLGO|nr:unnamed protein product [Cylicostephanus goldi]
MATAPSSFMSNNSIKNRARAGRERRTTVPDRPDLPINLWSIMKNCIGKESKFSVQEPFEQMAYVAAYAVSNYSTTGNRTNKPFNPLLGETYEFDRTADLGWRSITEQVSVMAGSISTIVPTVFLPYPQLDRSEFDMESLS